MTFRQISECLPAWLSAIEKGAGANAAPASVCQGDTTLPVQEEDTDKERRIALASPKAGMGRPSPAVRRSLFVVVEGGRPTGGGSSRAAYRAATGRERVREFLRLVVG